MQSGIFRQAIVISAASIVAFLTSFMLLSTISVNIIPNSYIHDLFFVKAFGALESIDNKTEVTNKTKKISLDGVVLSVYPKVEPELTTMTMKISDEKTGFPLTHVDWVIKIGSLPGGKEVFKSSTMHSHLGINKLTINFFNLGKILFLYLVASLGPKMLGMDIPPSGHTRIFKSGDPMTGWMTNQTYFFGARTAEFTIDIPNSQQTNTNLLTDTINNSNGQQGRGSSIDTSDVSSVKVLNGSENGNKSQVRTFDNS